MKYLLLALFLLIGSLSMAQVSASYYMSEKGQKIADQKRKQTIVDGLLLKQYGFVYNEQNDIYELRHGSWLYQFDVDVYRKRVIMDFYAFPIGTDYFNLDKQEVVLDAFHELVVYALKNNTLRPTVPYVLIGWGKNYKDIVTLR